MKKFILLIVTLAISLVTFALPTLKEGEQAVFFENTSNWSGDINAYLWADGGAIQWVGAWPGEACTYLGDNIWKWTYTGSGTIYGGLIFNCPSTGNQTADLEFVNGGYYDANGYVKTILPSEGEEIDTAQTIVYVAGSHTEWALTEDNLMQLQSGDSIYTKVYENMSAGSYEFKLVVNNYWIGAEEFDSLNSTPGVVCLLGGNISFTLDRSADVTICYNLVRRAITILAEGIDRFGKFEVEYYSICGSSAIFGEEFLTDAYRERIEEFKMIGVDGVYTKTLDSIALVADVEYRYKVAANGTWNEGQFPQVGDMIFYVSQTGLYDLTFTYIPDSAYLNVNPVLIESSDTIVETLPTIAEVIAMADETEVTVQGTVSYVAGSNFWIQDATGGILCYGKNNGLVEGELVTLSGVKTIYKGSPEINNATVVVKEVGTEVVAEPLSLSEVLADAINGYATYLNEMLYFEGVEISRYEDNGSYITPYITDGGTEIALYKWDGVTEDKFPVGSKVSVKAVLAIYNETLQLRGRVEWIEVAEKVYPTLKEGEQAVFFENTSNWSGDINAYLWADGGAIQWVGAWPGEACTYLGDNVWKWTYTGSGTIYGGLIFNCPSTGNQTADLEFVNGGYYDANGYVKTILPSEGEEIDTAQTIVYVAGSHTEWALTEDNLMRQSGDSIYSIVYENMSAGSYEFKLVVNNYWIGAEEFDSLNSTPGVVCLLGGNISFTLDRSADVTICYNLARRAITILAEGVDKFGQFEVKYYSICGSSAIFGEEFLTDAYRERIEEFKMIGEDGVYTKTLDSIALVADVEYRYKVAANGTWNEAQFPQVGDMIFYVSQTGLYDLTFTYIPDSAYLNVNPVLIESSDTIVETLPTIAEVIAMADETEVTVQGTVSYVAGSNFWIQDATGGILCYGKNNGLVEGELVTLSGVKTIYKGSPEINNATVVVKEVGTEVVAEPLSLSEVLADAINGYATYLNEMLYFEGVEISRYEDNGSYITPYITDGANEIALYKWEGLTEEVYPVGTKVSVKAVLSIYNETLQLRGRVEWIEVAEKGYYTLNVSTNYPDYASVEIQDNVGYNDNEATIYAYTNYIDLRFVRWSDGSTENPRTITLTSDTTLVAEFELCYAIKTYSVDETKGTITGGGQFSEGDSTTVTAIPAEGYMFDYFVVYKYSEGYATQVSFNPMIFDYIDQNYQIVAYFKKIPVLIDGLYYDLTDALEGITVRFYNSAWSQVNIWAWNENGNLFEEWPGVPMNNEGNGWWSYTFDPSIENINVVFNDGGNGYQTADVEGITENMCYGYAGDFEVPYVEDCGILNESRATVTYAYEGEYSGAIVVPDEVVYNNKTYKVTSIEERVFAGHPITSLSITNNITYVPELNLYGCYDLTQLKAHADLIDNISNLSTINIEELYVTGGYIDWLNKADYPSLKVLDLSATENYDLPYGFFKGEEYDYNYEGFAGLRKLVLPNNLNTIYNRQFRELWSLEEIVIPDGVTEIPEAAFYDCHALSNVTLSKNLTSIGNYAFYSCHALENIVIPEGVTEIGNAAFYGCTYLEKIEMPSTLEEVGNNAFALCSKVKSIKVKAHTPPTLWAKTFYEVDRNTPVYVAEVAYNDYVADQYWGEFFNIISVSESGTPTGVENADAESVVIYTQNGMLYIEGAETDYHVLDAAGRLIYTGRDTQLQLPRGVYMIAVGGEVQKVVL